MIVWPRKEWPVCSGQLALELSPCFRKVGGVLKVLDVNNYIDNKPCSQYWPLIC